MQVEDIRSIMLNQVEDSQRYYTLNFAQLI